MDLDTQRWRLRDIESLRRERDRNRLVGEIRHSNLEG